MALIAVGVQITVVARTVRKDVICGLCDSSARAVLLIDLDRWVTTCPKHIDTVVHLAQEYLFEEFGGRSNDVVVDEEARSYPWWASRATIDNVIAGD